MIYVLQTETSLNEAIINKNQTFITISWMIKPNPLKINSPIPLFYPPGEALSFHPTLSTDSWRSPPENFEAKTIINIIK